MSHQDWIVTFILPEAPLDYCSMVVHRQLDVAQVCEYIKRMFGGDIQVVQVVPLMPLDTHRHLG